MGTGGKPMKKLELIEDARNAWKFISMQLTALWALLFGWIASDPTIAQTVWNQLPAELQAIFPPWAKWLVAAGCMLGTIYAARIVKQKKLQKEPNEEQSKS